MLDINDKFAKLIFVDPCNVLPFINSAVDCFGKVNEVVGWAEKYPQKSCIVRNMKAKARIHKKCDVRGKHFQ